MKKFCLLLLVFLTTFNVFAKRSFNCDVTVSLQDESMDWWYFLPENSVPFVQDQKNVYVDQDLNFYLFFKFFEEMKEMSFDYEVFVIGEDGMEDIALEKTKFSFKDSQLDSIMPMRGALKYKFGFDKPLGRYDIVLRVVFENEIFDFVKAINLVEWDFPQVEKRAKRIPTFVFNYNELADAQRLISVFMSTQSPLLKKGAPKDLDYFFLSFFKHAFDAQPFLYNKLLQLYQNADEVLKKRILVLFAYANREFNTAVFREENDRQVYEYLSDNIIPDPYGELKGVFAPAQLDMLWGEYFATSSFKAFIKILYTLEHTKEGAFAEELVREGKKAQTEEEKKDFAVGMTYLNTLKRITLATENKLFLKYLYKAIESKKLPQSVSIQLAVLVKTANENAKAPKEPEIIDITKLSR